MPLPEDAAFTQATDMVGDVILRRVTRIRARLAADAAVIAAQARQPTRAFSNPILIQLSARYAKAYLRAFALEVVKAP